MLATGVSEWPIVQTPSLQTMPAWPPAAASPGEARSGSLEAAGLAAPVPAGFDACGAAATMSQTAG